MARSEPLAGAGAVLPRGAVEFLRRRAWEATGLALFATGAAFAVALNTYTPADPSFLAYPVNTLTSTTCRVLGDVP